MPSRGQALLLQGLKGSVGGQNGGPMQGARLSWAESGLVQGCTILLALLVHLYVFFSCFMACSIDKIGLRSRSAV